MWKPAICIFKRSARRILSTPALSGRNILVLSALKQMSKITPYHEHTHLVDHRNLRPFIADIFGVREEFFCPAFIRLNLVTALSRFREQCTFTWRPWILKCLEATRNWYHISPIWLVFSPGEEIVYWNNSQWHQITATTVEHETEWSCYSLFFSPAVPSNTPTHGRLHQENKMAASRTQRSASTI